MLVYYCDTAKPWGLYFQDSSSPQMEAIIELHNYIMYFLLFILLAVMWIMLSIVKDFTKNKFSNVYLLHGTLIELIWTITPALILIVIAFPSFKLLYITDDVTDPEITLKVEAHQWYWSYEYADFLTKDDEIMSFDSYMINESELEKGKLRMLEVDNRVILPELTHTRFNISSTDVIHSLACPSLGIKSDAYPIKSNQISVYSNREGTYFGQCSEICGLWHTSMPIVIQSVSLEKFLIFLKSQ
jgi:heme/copper-type cytochrome/quinol oxidase subunit 2